MHKATIPAHEQSYKCHTQGKLRRINPIETPPGTAASLIVKQKLYIIVKKWRFINSIWKKRFVVGRKQASPNENVSVVVNQCVRCLKTMWDLILRESYFLWNLLQA